jgi:putative peptide zinc metalloprotease protein
VAASLKQPRLRSDIAIVEQVYRGERSYIVKEHATHKYFRFKLLEILVMQQLDGEKTCAEVSAALAEQGLPLKPAAVEAFARKLNQMGLLERSLAERSVLQLERLRAERNRRVKRTHYQGSLLRMRFSVGDPDALLTRWLGQIRFLFSKPYVVASVAMFLTYFTVLAANWDAFQADAAVIHTPRLWTVGFVVLFYACFLFVATFHELGHALTCKYFGGEVHEMGVMLIYFIPGAYANVSDAWTFPERRSRLWVTAAGTWVQMVVAGFAAVVWLVAQPGTLVSRFAMVAMFIGGFTTVLANANPLIPLDGYYALSDWLEIPNLRQRAFRYVGWFVKRHLFRVSAAEPEADEREKRAFLVYGSLAFCYSTLILLAIGLAALGFVSRTLGAIGVLAFLFLVWGRLKRAARAFAQALITSLREHRALFGSGRFWRRLGLIGTVVVLAGVLVPWPIVVGGTFAAAAPQEITLTAQEEGLVWRVVAPEGARVPAGAPVVLLRNLDLEDSALAARLLADSLVERMRAARATGEAGETRRLETGSAAAAARFGALRARLATLTLRSPVAALVATRRAEEQIGRRVEVGDTVVRLLGNPDTLQLRVRLERAGAALVRSGQRVSLFARSDVGLQRRATVASVSAAGADDGDRGLEARVLIPADRSWRAGIRGEARVTVRRSSVLGALWWAVRKRLRNDLLL